MVWRLDDPQGNEAAKIKALIVPYVRGQGLDLGCGPYKAWPHMIGVDSGKDYGRRITDVSHVCERLPMFADRGLHFVFSSHLLEHIEDYKAALAEWWRVIEPGGHLILYLPHGDFYPKVGEPGANPDHKITLWPGMVIDAMREVAKESGWGWDLVENEDRNDDREYSFFQVYRKSAEASPACTENPWRKPDKALLICRYGAWGDHMFVSSALPLLKAQGWHITYNTTPKGKEILEHDPHIDAWLIQDKDQVPNEDLSAYWAHLGQRYDRVVNLSESVEGTLLTLPGRKEHEWPDEVRRAILGPVNYLERTHQLCGVPTSPIRPRFYPSPEEAAWARRTLDKARYGTEKPKRLKPGAKPNPVVLWVLSGSALHKVWPHVDAVIARLMLDTKATVILVGDYSAKILEVGWEKEPRVWQRSGEMTIRETLALARQCDVVVGPETGVLNAVSAEENVRKVVFLSHSSHENLTKHWVNTAVMEPVNTPCFPCHRMQYNWDWCHEAEIDGQKQGVARCAWNIAPGPVYEAIAEGLAKPEQERAA